VIRTSAISGDELRMKEPLDEKIKKEIDEWRNSGDKFCEWIEDNLDKLNKIYCNKETVVFDHNMEISSPIRRISLDENEFLLVEGKGYRKWIGAFLCSFGEKYTMTITAPFFTQKPEQLKIGFQAYVAKRKEAFDLFGGKTFRNYKVYSGKIEGNITEFSIKMENNYHNVNHSDDDMLSIFKINNTDGYLDFAKQNKSDVNILGKLEDIIKTKSEIERKTGFKLIRS